MELKADLKSKRLHEIVFHFFVKLRVRNGMRIIKVEIIHMLQIFLVVNY